LKTKARSGASQAKWILWGFIVFAGLWIAGTTFVERKAGREFDLAVRELDARFQQAYPIGTDYRTVARGLQEVQVQDTVSIRKGFHVVGRDDQLIGELLYDHVGTGQGCIFTFGFGASRKLTSYTYRTYRKDRPLKR
jgi:hypothetical protein